MPEEVEVETEKLREAVHEELEKENSDFLKQIALTTAILAAFAAVGSLQAGDTVNEALVLKTEATRLQAQASDQWAYYQAKGIKGALQEAARAPWLAVAKAPPADLQAQQKRYADEQAAIQQKAEDFERQRDAKERESAQLLHRHHGFARSVTLFQIAIALGAVAALTRVRLVWIISSLLGLTGIVLFLYTWLS